MKIIDKLNVYVNENKQFKPAELERMALELIRTYQHYAKHENSGDIESMVQDFAHSHGLNAEDFYEVVLKSAKKNHINLWNL